MLRSFLKLQVHIGICASVTASCTAPDMSGDALQADVAVAETKDTSTMDGALGEGGPDTFVVVDGDAEMGGEAACVGCSGDAKTIDVPAPVSPTLVLCEKPTLTVTTSQSTLIPPPLAVSLQASQAGKPVPCSWSAGPASVCKLLATSSVRKVGDGVCTVACHEPDGTCGQATLVAKKQTVIYTVGGASEEGKLHSAQISRLRVADGQWDAQVAIVPEKRHGLALGFWAGKLFLVGGFVYSTPAAYEHDPVFFPKCPEAQPDFEFGKPSSDSGCRAVRTLDLGTGDWGVAVDLPKNRWDMGSLQVGQALYLLGGGQSVDNGSPYDETLIYRLDMSKAKLTSLIDTPDGFKGTHPSAVVWQGELLIFNTGKTWSFSPVQAVLSPVDIGFPCKNIMLPGAFAFPSSEANIFVFASDFGPCPWPPQANTGILRRYYKGKWTDTQPFQYVGSFKPAVGPEAVYLLPGNNSFSLGTPVSPVLVIPSIEGKWSTLPAAPYWRSDFAAIAVEQ